MSEVTTRRPGRPRQEIEEDVLLEAALSTFASDGFRAARVELVAERAGVTKPLLFRRFRTKSGLFDWTIDRELGLLTDRLFTAYERVEDARLATALQAGAEALIDYATERPDGFRLLLQVGDVGAGGTHDVAEKVRAVVTDRMEEIVARRLERGSAHGGERSAVILAAAIVGASEHVARRCVENPDLDPAAAARLLASMLTTGLRDLPAADIVAADRPRGRS